MREVGDGDGVGRFRFVVVVGILGGGARGRRRAFVSFGWAVVEQRNRLRGGFGSGKEEFVDLVLQTRFQRADPFFEVEAEGDKSFDDLIVGRLLSVALRFVGGTLVAKLEKDEKDAVL